MTRRPLHLPKMIAHISRMTNLHYRNDPKFLDRQVWANIVDPDQLLEELSDQGLRCLPLRLHLLDAAYSMARPPCSNFRSLGVRIFRIFYGNDELYTPCECQSVII